MTGHAPTKQKLSCFWTGFNTSLCLWIWELCRSLWPGLFPARPLWQCWSRECRQSQWCSRPVCLVQKKQFQRSGLSGNLFYWRLWNVRVAAMQNSKTVSRNWTWRLKHQNKKGPNKYEPSESLQALLILIQFPFRFIWMDFRPGTIAFTPAESKPCILSATMLAPAFNNACMTYVILLIYWYTYIHNH